MSDLHADYQQYLAIQEQIKTLQAQATALMQAGRNKAIDDIKALIKVYEIRADEVGFPVPPSAPKRERKNERRRDRTIKGDPKYRDPETGATWTGAGRTPNWIVGKNPDDFLITPSAPPDTPVPVPAHELAPAAPATSGASNGAPEFSRQS